jgi:hypothetical protein
VNRFRVYPEAEDSMDKFPRTEVGGVSLSRMIIGTNWFLGWSHTTHAKDAFIKENIADRNKIADIIEVFFRAGVDTIMGQIAFGCLADAVKEAEDRTGVKAIVISTPGFPIGPETPVKGFDLDAVKRILDKEVALGATFCMPHQGTTDAMVDRCTRSVRKMDQLCKLIRERGLIPGLSTHMPESIIYADETNLDVETYISIYNSMGFLMQVEVDWIAKVIRGAKKPVMTIKPMAAGQLRPFQGLTFVWNTIRPQDMVTVGTMTPKEAAEVIELSMSILDGRQAELQLQETRSKASIKHAVPA